MSLACSPEKRATIKDLLKYPGFDQIVKSVDFNILKLPSQILKLSSIESIYSDQLIQKKVIEISKEDLQYVILKTKTFIFIGGFNEEVLVFDPEYNIRASIKVNGKIRAASQTKHHAIFGVDDNLLLVNIESLKNISIKVAD